MDDLILKRCKYCDKTYEGTSESCCCSEPCNIKYQKYNMKQREKTETPVKIFSIIEDKGLQKRGVKKTKILFRTIWGTVLIYILTYYFLEQF